MKPVLLGMVLVVLATSACAMVSGTGNSSVPTIVVSPSATITPTTIAATPTVFARPSASAEASPTLSRRRIIFQTGAVSATIQGTTATPGMDRFVLRALAGQTMTVNVASAQNNVIVIIYGADGDVLISDHAGATRWTGVLRLSQDYNIDTRSVADAVVPFTLTVTIPPR